MSLPFLKTITVKAANTAPTSCFTPSTVSPFEAPAVGQPPKKVTFTACGGTLDDTTANADLKYQWLVNGQVQSTNPGSFDLSIDGTGDYTKLDDYKVELIVTDKEGLSTPTDDPVKMQQPTVVQVKPFNQPPVAKFSYPSGILTAPIEVTVDALTDPNNKSSDPDGKIVEYKWEASNGQTASGSTANAKLSFSAGGEYQVTLTVKDDKGKTDTVTKSITVKQQLVHAKIGKCVIKETGADCLTTNPKPGETFDITLDCEKDVDQPADGVEVEVKLDPQTLRLNSVTPLTEGFNFTLDGPNYVPGGDTINFSAIDLSNGVPSTECHLMTLNLTALKETLPNSTDLKITTQYASQGVSLPLAQDTRKIYIGATTSTPSCQVTWAGGRSTPPSGNEQLTVYCVSANTSSPCLTANLAGGSCTFPQQPSLPAGTQYLCVKSKNTLGNKITNPDNFLKDFNFGELLYGDFTTENGTTGNLIPDGKMTLNDNLFSDPVMLNGSKLGDCKATGATYNDLIDLNGDGCYTTGDAAVFAKGYGYFKKLNPTTAPPVCLNDGGTRKGQRSNSNGQVTFQTTPIPTGLSVGSTFDVQVLVNVDTTHSVDGATVSLNYDPQRLKVVSLTAGTQLDYVLQQDFDNTQGQIEFAAILLANKLPTDTFSLVTINFTLLGENGERTLSFNTTAPRETAAALAGQYVNAPVQPSAIKFAEKPLTYVISDYLLDPAGHPLAGVTIHIGDQTAVTNENGYWKITDLPEGSYTVTAQKDDYSFTTAPCALSREQMDCQMVKPKSLLKLTVDYPPEVTLQQEFDYTITITNGSPKTVTGVFLTDTLPNGVAALSLNAATGGQCDLSTLICNGLTLDAGASATFKLHVINLQSTTLNNTLTVAANEQPAAVKTVTSTVKPDLSVTVKDTPDPVGMQKDLQYEVTVALADQATSAATGVTLELTLPTGVTLKTLTVEQGQCDTTTSLPKVICHLDDLSLEGLKQVPLTLTTSLQDAGLLLLTLQAKLSSNEYATTTVRERTKVFVPPEVKVDLALVIDTTNSMQGEIDGVKAALKKFMATIDPNTAPLVALITFKDEVSVKAFTRDMNVLLKAIDALKAEGGGTCPEASVEALAFTVVHVKKGGQIWFTTDASPYPDADIDGLTKLLQDNETVLNATITGDCSMVESVNDAQWEDVVNGK